jgi:integrase
MLTTDMQIRNWKDKPKTRKSCGKGLYIRIFSDGSKTFELRTKQQWVTLGQYPILSLADASDITSMSKRLLKSNTITTEALRALMTRAESAWQLEDLAIDKLSLDASLSEIITFDQAFREWYALQLKANSWRHKASVRFPMSAYQTHVKKHLGNLRIDKISRPLIKKFMQPLFLTNSETARKLLGYMHKVFEIAYDNELIIGNPCPKKESFTVPNRKVQHSASLHFTRLPEIWGWLVEAPYSASVKVAMQLAVITTRRSTVITNMRWQDFNCENGVWTIPEGPVGLSEAFIKSDNSFSLKLPSGLSEALLALPCKCDYVFSLDGLKPINAETLRRNFQKFDKITTHGFRNTFKTWALNQDPPIDTFLVNRYCGHALTGLFKNYRRDDLFAKRAELAERYYDYCKGFEWFVRRSRS